MKIFHIKNEKLTQTKEVKFKLEKELQEITQKNLESILNLDFVRSEFPLKDKMRIDTLAFDREKKIFVIIEYKKGKSSDIIGQGVAYLTFMKKNKADFILEYNEKMNGNLKKNDVDWLQSKVILMANSFNNHQKQAIDPKNPSMEFWEVKKYDNGTILYNQLNPLDAAESITTVPESDTIKDVSKEIKDVSKEVKKRYSADDVLKKKWKKTYELYNSLKEKILEFEPRLEENFTKVYIGFQINQRNVMEVYQQKEKIKVHLLKIHPTYLKKIEGIEVIYEKDSMKYFHRHVSFIIVNDVSEVDSAMVVIKQVIERFDI